MPRKSKLYQEKATSNGVNKLAPQLVCKASDFFKNAVEKEKLELKKQPSSFSLFSFMLNKVYSALLKFIEDIIGIQLYVAPDNFSLKLSSRTKNLIASFTQKKIITRIQKLQRVYYDEPEITAYWLFAASASPDISLYSDGQGVSVINGGADWDEERALMKAVGEGLERFCLCVYREKNLLVSSYDKIFRKALDPLSFAGISALQRKNNKRLRIDEKSIFRWVEGFSLFDRRKIFIPAQLVYIGYKYHPQEPYIQQQISTGAAAADSFEEALYRGICEAVERDAFMVNYLNKFSPPLIDLEAIDNENFQRLLKMFKRYNLELYVLDITTDIAIPSVMAVIIDRTGVGPAVHVGTKTSLNIKEAILGVVCECLRGRLSFRGVSSPPNLSEEKLKFLRSNPSQIKTFADRSNFWALPEMIDKIEFLFQGPKKIISKDELSKHQNVPVKEKLKLALNLLRERKIDVCGVDITMPPIKEEGIYVAKVVSPQLQPLYLNESLRHISGERIFRAPVTLGYRKEPLLESEINQIPHPFL